MWTLVRRRCLDAILVIWVIGTAAFVALHLAPGDPLTAVATDPRVTPAVRAQWRAIYGLDVPLGTQYARHLRAMVRGDLGFSISQQRPVLSALRDAVPRSLVLVVLAVGAALLVGSVIGSWQAVHPGSAIDRWTQRATAVLSSVPDAWLALMLLALLGAQWRLLPLGGLCDPADCNTRGTMTELLDRLQHAVLPWLTLTLLAIGSVARVQRTALGQLLADASLRTARGKGATPWRIVSRHAEPRALRSVVALAAVAMPAMLGGAVVIERVFGWPGVGSLLVQGVAMRDYSLVTAIAQLGALMVVGCGLLADVASATLDPRVRPT